jgi:hypothetical protein
MQAGMEFWAPHIEAMERESVTTKVYAERHGLALHSLYYWRQKIKAAAEPKVAETGDRNSAFVALRVEESVTIQRPGGCTLTLGDGVRVEFSTMPSPEWLAALKHALQGAN